MPKDEKQEAITDTKLKTVEKCIYLKDVIRIGEQNQTKTISRGIRLRSLSLKQLVFDACVLQVLTFAIETIILTEKRSK